MNSVDLQGLRVGFVITRMIVGGAQATVLETIRRLKAKGLACEMITGPETGPEGDLFEEVSDASIPLLFCTDLVREVNPFKDIKALFGLWRLFRQRRYSIVHTNSSKAGVLGRIAARMANVPVVVHWVHGYAFNQYQSRLERGIYLFLEQLCGRLTSHSIVVSRPLLDRTVRNRIAGPDGISLVYSGIELENYLHSQGRAEVRAGIGLPVDALVVGCVARLVDGKGHHDLLRAFAQVHERRPDTHLVLVGDGPLRPELESVADSLGITDAVSFLGLRRDVPRLMCAFDILALASLWEGMGRVLLEAMASGVAVVATRVGGIVDLIQDGVNGLLAEPRDPSSFSAALLRLVEQPRLRVQLAERGTALVGGRYSIDATAEAILALYRVLLQEVEQFSFYEWPVSRNGSAKSKPKILRVVTRLNVGGPAIHTILLTKGLGSSYETVLVSGIESPSEGNMMPLADRLGVPVIRIPDLRREIEPLRDLIALVELVKLMRREKPQIVHTHTAKAGCLGRIAGRLCRVPVVVHTFHGHVFRGYFGPRKTRMLLLIERFLAMLSDQVIAVNEQQRAELADLGVASKSKILSVPLGLDLASLAYNGVEPGIMRKKWGIPVDAPTVGIVARLVHIKGHELFLDSAVEVHRRYPQAWFVVVGDGERRNELQTYAAKLDIPVVFAGWETALDAVYSALDMVCLTSYNEGSPVALIEALAAGKPVIATAVGGVQDLVRDGDTGVLIKGRDPKAFAQAICLTLDNPDQAQQMGRRGKASVYPAHDVSKLLENLGQVYEDLLSRRPRRAGLLRQPIRRPPLTDADEMPVGQAI